MNESARAPEVDRGNWTLALRRSLEHRFPLVNLLPHRQPYFVASWVYVFGVVAIIAAFGMQAVGKFVPWDGFRLLRHFVFGIGGFSLAWAAWQARRFELARAEGERS